MNNDNDTIDPLKNTYWNNTGKWQHTADQLHGLLPREGAVAGKALEKFRKAANAYYDLFNNGRCINFKRIFGVRGKALLENMQYARGLAAVQMETVESVMDKIILAAAKEQGIE